MLAPGVFGEDERGHCAIVNEEVAPDLEPQARLGEANCPEGAIEIEAK
jgi:ferredoxin